MPPKKKARLSSQAASSSAGHTAEHVPVKRNSLSKADNVPPAQQSDAWTDEQEAALFKGVIRWKPVGWFP